MLFALLIHGVLVLSLHASHIIRQLLLKSCDLVGMHLVLLIHLLNALLLLIRHLLLKALDLVLQLLNFLNQRVLVLFLQLGVLLDLLSDLHNLGLKLFSSGLAVPDKLFIFGNIFLQIIENLQLLVQRNKRVQLVLELYLLLFEGELKLVLLTLVEHALGETASSHNSRCCDGLSHCLFGRSACLRSFWRGSVLHPGM